jgi:hypothetical protein
MLVRLAPRSERLALARAMKVARDLIRPGACLIDCGQRAGADIAILAADLERLRSVVLCGATSRGASAARSWLSREAPDADLSVGPLPDAFWPQPEQIGDAGSRIFHAGAAALFWLPVDRRALALDTLAAIMTPGDLALIAYPVARDAAVLEQQWEARLAGSRSRPPLRYQPYWNSAASRIELLPLVHDDARGMPDAAAHAVRYLEPDGQGIDLPGNLRKMHHAVSPDMQSGCLALMRAA